MLSSSGFPDLYIIFLPGHLGDLVLSLSTLFSKFNLPKNILVVTRKTNKPVANLFKNEFKFLFFDDKVLRPWHRFLGLNLKKHLHGLTDFSEKNILIINPYTYSPIGHFGLDKKKVSVISFPSAGAAAFSENFITSTEALDNEYAAHEMIYGQIFKSLKAPRAFNNPSKSALPDQLPNAPFLLLHLETSRLDKNIDLERVESFVRNATEVGLSIVITGSKRCKIELFQSNKSIYDMRGMTTFLELAKLVQSASYVLSADTVTAHLAQLSNVQQFVLLTKFQPNFMPFGSQICFIDDYDDLRECF